MEFRWIHVDYNRLIIIYILLQEVVNIADILRIYK